MAQEASGGTIVLVTSVALETWLAMGPLVVRNIGGRGLGVSVAQITSWIVLRR